MPINVEKELDGCVERMGGTLVRNLVGPSPNFDNADYLFEDFGIVAELKILTVDQMLEPRVKDKLTEIYREALAQGGTDAIVYGEAQIASGRFSPEYARKIGEVYRKPIKRRVEKANKQIRKTKEHLRLAEYSGLLILVNDNNRALEPQHVHWMLQETLRDRNFSSIDSVIYFTANLKAQHVALQTDFLVWFELQRTALRPCDERLLLKIRQEWIRRMSELSSEQLPIYRLRPESLSKLGHKF